MNRFARDVASVVFRTHPAYTSTSRSLRSWWEASRVSSAYDVLRGRPVIYGVDIEIPHPQLVIKDSKNLSVRRAGIKGASLNLPGPAGGPARISHNRFER